MSNNNNNETLKPGDRVRLTGWAKQNPSIQLLFDEDGLSLPIECYVRRGEGEHGPDTNRIVCLTGWSVDWFTYEIITDDGNG